MSKTLLRINIQHKLFTKTGEKPTVPSPSDLKPGEDGFGDTDILEGEWAYNRADDIWYYRSNNQIKELSGANVEYATQPESEESDPSQAIDDKSMSPLRTLQAFISHAKNYVFSVLNTANKTLTGAINELENNKSNTGHTHVEGDITNLDKYSQSTVDSKLDEKVTKDGDSPGAGTKLRVGKKDNGTFALIAGDIEIATFDQNGNFTINGQSDSNSVTAFIVNALSQNGLFKVQSDGSISAYAFQGSGLTNLHTDSAGNLIATEPIYSFLVQDLADQSALEDTNNWDANNSFTGTLSNTKQGQYWYDSTYFYTMLEDNLPIRKDRTNV